MIFGTLPKQLSAHFTVYYPFALLQKLNTTYSKKGILLNQFNEIKIWHQPQSFMKTFSTLHHLTGIDYLNIFMAPLTLSVLKLFIAMNSFQT